MNGRAFKNQIDDNILLTRAGWWLIRWLHWGGLEAVVYYCKTPWTSSQFAWM